jgi:hypothetical protein
VRNRHNFSTANIPSSNQKDWTTTTSNVIRKTPNISQLEHKKNRKSHRVPLHSSTDKGEVSQKKTMAVHPLSASTHAPQWSLVVPTPVISWLLLAVGLNSNSATYHELVNALFCLPVVTKVLLRSVTSGQGIFNCCYSY